MRLLILSSNTGEGHNSAAAAIASAGISAGIDVSIRRPLEESGRINRALGNLYNTLLKRKPQWMTNYLRLIDFVRPNDREFLYRRERRFIGRFLESTRPDVILSVHPMLNHFIQRFIKEERVGIPCDTFVTDPFPPFWSGWSSAFVDRYYVVRQEAALALTEMGVDPRRIDQVAMPVRSPFTRATMSEIHAFRSDLKLDGATTILINGGARGGGPIYRIYQTVRRADSASNIIVICGRNERLRSQIEAGRDPKTRTFGFVTDMHRFIASSDLVLTKPGALSTYEALACNVPPVLLGILALMPQESGMFEAAKRYDFGFSAMTFADLEGIIRLGPRAWSRKREAIPHFYRGSSGEEIIERIQPLMPERKTVFVTGATGFLGSHLTFRLLEQGHRVRVLARGSKSASAKERAEDALRNVAGGENELRRFSERLEVIEGDISQPNLGMSDSARQNIVSSTDEVWHCAASLSFAEEDREEIFRMNVGGTAQILSLVEQIPSRRLQHVSTAYVAGNRPDLALESDIDVGQTFKNPYEESKCRSELLVAEAHKKHTVQASVYRPSIVIGDSKTGHVTHFHGVYAFIRALWTALERLRRKAPGDGPIHLPLRVLGSKGGTLNFVPIDYVVDGMVTIAATPASLGQTYHLTNPRPTPNTLWLPHMSRIMGVEGVEIVEEERFANAPMTRLEGIFQKQMAFYYMYLQGEPRFDCSHTLQALTGTGITCPPVTVPFIEKMAGWYLDYLRR